MWRWSLADQQLLQKQRKYLKKSSPRHKPHLHEYIEEKYRLFHSQAVRDILYCPSSDRFLLEEAKLTALNAELMKYAVDRFCKLNERYAETLRKERIRAKNQELASLEQARGLIFRFEFESDEKRLNELLKRERRYHKRKPRTRGKRADLTKADFRKVASKMAEKYEGPQLTFPGFKSLDIAQFQILQIIRFIPNLTQAQYNKYADLSEDHSILLQDALDRNLIKIKPS